MLKDKKNEVWNIVEIARNKERPNVRFYIENIFDDFIEFHGDRNFCLLYTSKLAEDLKKRFYGNRIVMFAPLYLSNYCVNGCVYCPYHAKNKTIARKKLTQDEIRREVIALQDMGHKRLALEAGEDPVNNPIEYILECINTCLLYTSEI